jgi:hypothetical protein
VSFSSEVNWRSFGLCALLLIYVYSDVVSAFLEGLLCYDATKRPAAKAIVDFAEKRVKALPADTDGGSSDNPTTPVHLSVLLFSAPLSDVARNDVSRARFLCALLLIVPIC